MIAISLVLLSVGTLSAENGGNQEICPIMGNKINSDVFCDFNGERVYFCCAGCIPEFKKDPEGHVKKMKADGIQLKQLKPQSLCPVMGNPINKKSFVDVEGKRVYMCCPGCASKIKENPQKYFKLVAEKDEYLEDLKGDK